MKVSELKSGMLLKPAPGLKLFLMREKAFFRKEKEEKDITTVRFGGDSLFYGDKYSRVSGPIIYLGSKFDDFVWDGVYKHHRVLAGDTIAVLSGYHVKNLSFVGEL
mgnify:CR=1 FL=1